MGVGILSNRNGSLFESIAPRIIDECSTRVAEVLCRSPNAESPSSFKKRGKYSVYSPNGRACIGMYAAEHGLVETTICAMDCRGNAAVTADRKLVFKGFEKACIADSLSYEFK